MLVLITYDVSTETSEGKRRLAKIAKACKNFGLRAQNSVFECEVDPSQWVILKNNLLKIVNVQEDSLRFYFLGSNWERKIEHYGIMGPIDMHGLLLL
ncbi:MAG: CRISPR-associated endonuclease Cas2 [Paludibacteraceae bacterium]|nr:CRISPR-associated endonuclease Cas2 [Paludibacteraceae bacterium]